MSDALRYEAWTLPWDASGFRRKVARLPAIPGSGSGSPTFLTTGGDGSVSLANFTRLAELISPTEGSLVRVYDEAVLIDEWFAERVQHDHDDENRVDHVAGGILPSVLDKYIIYPYDRKDPTIQGDWVWGGDVGSGILDNGDFELTPFPNGGFEDGSADYWQGTQDDDGLFSDGFITVINSPADAHGGDWFGFVNPQGSGGGVRRSIGGLISGEVYTVAGWVRDATAAGDRIIAGVIGASTASHTNAFQVDDVWYAELGNVAQGTGATNGNWQQVGLTFRAAGDQVELFIKNEETAGVNFRIDDWAIAGDGIGISPWVGFASRGGGGSTALLNYARHSTAQSHSGLGSLEMQGVDDAFISLFNAIGYGAIGVRQDVNLVVGRTYTMTAWVRHNGGAAENMRIMASRNTPRGPLGTTTTGVQGVLPGGISLAHDTQLVAPNTWTKLQFTFVPDVSDLSMSLRYAGSTGRTDVGAFTSPTIWWDDVSLHEGLPATTPGDMGQLIFTAVGDRGLLDWLDFSSWDAVNDSNTDPWPTDLSLAVPWGSSLGQFLDQLVDLGIEWEIRAKATPVGSLTHDLFLYISGGRDDAPAAAINVGQGVTGGEVVSRIPEFTKVLVEGAEGGWAEVDDAGTQADFGILEKFVVRRELTDDGTRTILGNEFLAFEEANRRAVRFDIVSTSDHRHPLVAYRTGDTIPMQLPPGLAKENRRVQRVDYVNTEPTQYTVVGSRLIEGEAAAFDLVWRMWRRFTRPKDPVRTPMASGGEGGAMPTITIAASDASDYAKAAAHFVCEGADDEVLINFCINLLSITGGRINLTEGTFHLSAPILLGYPGSPGQNYHLFGSGRDVTILDVEAGTHAIKTTEVGNTISELTALNEGIEALHASTTIKHVTVQNAAIGFDMKGSFSHLLDAITFGCTLGLSVDADSFTGIALNVEGILVTGCADVYLQGQVPIATNVLHIVSSSHVTAHLDGFGGSGGGGAILIENESHHNTIWARLRDCGQHAVTIDDSDDNWVFCWAEFSTSGTDNTFDLFHLLDDADRNRLIGGARPGDSTHGWRWGANITTADCDGNRVMDLDLEDMGTGTITDSGTGTKIGPLASEWNLGAPAGRTTGDVITWTGSAFELVTP